MEALKQAEQLFSGKLAIIKTMFTIFRLEARLAGLSVVPLLFSFCLFLIVLMTLWILTSLLIGYGILLACHNFPLSLILTFLLNLVVALVLAKYLLLHIKNMSFEKTRAYFSPTESIDDEQFTKTNPSSNSHDGSNISATAKSSTGE